MVLDPRSRIGRQLEVETPAQLDLAQLDPAVAALVGGRMDRGMPREEALLSTISFLGKFAHDSVVALDTNRVFAAHPEVERAVTRLTESGLSRGKAITRLLLDGSQEQPRVRRTNFNLADLEKGLIEEHGYTRNPDGSLSVPGGGPTMTFSPRVV